MRGVAVVSNFRQKIEPIYCHCIGVPRHIGSTQKPHKRNQKKLHTTHVYLPPKPDFKV